MAGSVRRFFGAVARSSVHAFGKTIVDCPKHWSDPDHLWARILALKPDVVLDVGANVGQFALELRSAGYAGRLISFEPQPEAFGKLKEITSADRLWQCHQIAMGDTSGRLAMNISAFSPSSSLLSIGRLHTELMPHTAEIDKILVNVARLDDLATTENLENKRLFLKIDVQGYELPVLRGAARLLRSVDGVLVELNFAPLFDGQSKYFDVIRLLDEAGLGLASIVSVNKHPETGDWLWGDGFFTRAIGAA